jgi:predicted small lipoprotein YifL
MTFGTISKAALIAVVIAIAAAPLSACGRKSTLKAPADGDPAYPRTYPAPEKAPGEKK